MNTIKLLHHAAGKTDAKRRFYSPAEFEVMVKRVSMELGPDLE